MVELAKALLAAQRDVRPVEKGSKNKHHDYMYASADDVMSSARGVLHKHALIVSPIDCEVVGDFTAERPTGLLKTKYLLEHESGESRLYTSQTPIVPDRGRPPDKATAASKTMDLGYFLRGLLQMERVDESDIDGRDDTGYVPPHEKKQIDAKRKETKRAPVTADERREAVKAKLAELTKLHGGDACNGATQGMPRATIEDKEAMVKAILDKLGKYAKQPGETDARAEASAKANGIIKELEEEKNAMSRALDKAAPKQRDYTTDEYDRIATKAGFSELDRIQDLRATYGASHVSDLDQEQLNNACRRMLAARDAPNNDVEI